MHVDLSVVLLSWRLVESGAEASETFVREEGMYRIKAANYDIHS